MTAEPNEDRQESEKRPSTEEREVKNRYIIKKGRVPECLETFHGLPDRGYQPRISPKITANAGSSSPHGDLSRI